MNINQQYYFPFLGGVQVKSSWFEA